MALAALLLPAAGLRGADDEVEGDLKKLQGKWTAKAGNGDAVTYSIKGNTLPGKKPSDCRSRIFDCKSLPLNHLRSEIRDLESCEFFLGSV